MMSDILRIRNWSEYQHYKDRCPPWIKLHYRILSSRDWVMLDDRSRVLAVACMLIASQSDDTELSPGEFRADAEYIMRVAYLNSIPDFKPLIKCGFLEVASGCKQVLANDTKRSPETETETETETEKKERGSPDGDPPAPKKKRGTRIPDDFPTDDQLRWASEECPKVDQRQEAEKFRDYWLATPGQKGVKLDWPATWRNWIRRAAEYNGANSSKPKMADDHRQKTYEGTADEDLPPALR